MAWEVAAIRRHSLVGHGGLVEAGWKVVDRERGPGVSEQTSYIRRRQDRIDHELESGVTSRENAALAPAGKQIQQLETDVAVAQRAVKPLTALSDANWMESVMGRELSARQRIQPVGGGLRVDERAESQALWLLCRQFCPNQFTTGNDDGVRSSATTCSTSPMSS